MSDENTKDTQNIPAAKTRKPRSAKTNPKPLAPGAKLPSIIPAEPVDDGVFPWETSSLFDSVENEGDDQEPEEADYENQEGESVNPFTSPLRLWAYKTGRIVRSSRKNPYWSAVKRAIAQVVAREQDLMLDDAPKRFVHQDNPAMVAPVEFMLSEDNGKSWGPMVIKSVPEESRQEWERYTASGSIPQSDFLSLQHSMETSDSECAWLVASCGPKAGYVIRIERDREVGSYIFDAIKAFWDAVTSGRQPAADPERDEALVTKLYGLSDKEDITADFRGDNRLREIVEIKDAIKVVMNQQQKEIDAINAEIAEKMKGVARALVSDEKELFWVRSQAKESVQKRGPMAYIRSKKPKK